MPNINTGFGDTRKLTRLEVIVLSGVVVLTLNVWVAAVFVIAATAG